jgi:hypothetical protein
MEARMADDWVLDVLADLTDFAQRNELPVLAAELERTRDIARAELAARQAERGGVAEHPLDVQG